MRKKYFLLLAVMLTVGGWQLFDKFEIRGLDGIQLIPKNNSDRRAASPASTQNDDSISVARTGDSVRVATFNIQVFGERKTSKTHVMEYLANITRRFDVVAIQEIRARNPDVIPHFVDLVNSTGRHYDYVIGERLGRTSSKEQYAFVFDRQTIEVDRNELYTVLDPDDMLHREPLVAWFRVRGPPPAEAFTFSLVNIHTDPDETREELNALDDVYLAVLNDGRNEDDVIVLGDLNVDYRHLGDLGRLPDMSWVIKGQETNTRKTKSYDNILFNRRATAEFLGRGGVFDFMREFNLTTQEALEISDHLPVWAEFSIFEGGQPGRLAARPGVTGTR